MRKRIIAIMTMLLVAAAVGGGANLASASVSESGVELIGATSADGGDASLRSATSTDGGDASLRSTQSTDGGGASLTSARSTDESGASLRSTRTADVISARDASLRRRPTIDRIRERGVLLVGTTGDYSPLTFLEQDGSYSGFDIELAEVIAEKIGVSVRFVATSWPTLAEDVMAEPQKFDIAVGGITITDQRREAMLMSDGYISNGKTILCRSTDAARFKSLEDIDRADVRVMVNPGGTNEKFARERLAHATLIVHESNLEIPHLIAEDAADIMITEITEAPFYISKDERLAAPLIGTPFTNSSIGILMRKGQKDLLRFVNKTLARLKSDGTLQALHKKYGLD